MPWVSSVQNTGATNELKINRWMIERIRLPKQMYYKIYIFSIQKKIIKFRGYVVCGMPGVYKSRGSRRYLYIKDSVGIDRILLPMLSPDTWKFILINCLLCYDPTYNSNVTLRNVTVNYFQTQFLLFSSISPYTFYALINT